MKRTSRKPSKLSESTQRHLNAYAIAASAAGVGMLALAQPAEAKIIYTKTHKVIGSNGTYNLDVNHDGTVDFIIREWGTALFAKEAYGNAVRGYAERSSQVLASALKRDAQIGPGTVGFVKSGYYGEGMAYAGNTNGTTWAAGPWVNVNNRYLGLKFKIDGKTHYGWARLSVKVKGLNITATLTGYAYESTPNKSILAGQTQGKCDDPATPNSAQQQASQSRTAVADPSSSAPQPASLGMLARGAVQVLRWR